MEKLNEEGAPNNNLNSMTIQSSNLVNEEVKYPYSKEKFASGKKDQITRNQIKK